MRPAYEAYQKVLFWIVAGVFALGGFLSLRFGENSRALTEFGIAAVIVAVIYLRARRSR